MSIDDSPLYLCHIPKTAGTSLRYWLSDLFDDELCCNMFHYSEIKYRPSKEFERFRFFAGHHGGALHRKLPFITAKRTVAMLRDPVQREMSQIAYLRRFGEREIESYGSSTWAAAKLVRSLQNKSIVDVLNSDFFQQNYADAQVRFLTGHGPPDDSPGRVSRQALADAKNYLLRIGAVGLVERGQRAMLLLSDFLRLPFRPLEYRLNTGSVETGPLILSDSERAAIEASNQLDADLYAFAEELEEDRYYQLLARLGLKDSNPSIDVVAQCLDEAFRTAPTRGAFAPAILEQNRGLVCRGWGPRFPYEPAGRWLRWAQKSRPGVLWLPVDRRAARQIRVEMFYSTDACLDSLEVSVDGFPQEISLARLRWKEDVSYVEAALILPPLSNSMSYTELQFATTALDTTHGEDTFAIGKIHIS